MEDGMLIEEVRQYQQLYETTHKKYSDNIHKDVWRKIHNFFSSSFKIKAIITSCFLPNLGMLQNRIFKKQKKNEFKTLNELDFV
jgi:hypothetical protein